MFERKEKNHIIREGQPLLLENDELTQLWAQAGQVESNKNPITHFGRLRATGGGRAE